MLDYRITLGEYTCVIQQHVALGAGDLTHVERLYHEEVPLWLVLAGLLLEDVTFKDLADTLIRNQEEA